MPFLDGLVGGDLSWKARRNHGFGSWPPGLAAKVVARIRSASIEEFVELAELHVRMVVPQQFDLAELADLSRLRGTRQIMADFFHQFPRRAPGLEMFSRLKEPPQAGIRTELVRQQKSSRRERLEHAEIQVAVEAHVQRDLGIGIKVRGLLQTAPQHIDGDSRSLHLLQYPAPVGVEPSDLPHESHRTRRGGPERAVDKPIIQGRNPVQVSQTRSAKNRAWCLVWSKMTKSKGSSLA